MCEKKNVLNYDVHLLELEEYREQLTDFLEDDQLQSMLFLSVPILELAMEDEEYLERITSFQLLLPGEKDILIGQAAECVVQSGYMVGTQYLKETLTFLQAQQKTLYLIGDQFEISSRFMEYCKGEYPELKLVGSFVGGSQMEDANLINDINVTCPDVILTAIAPGVQEDWILNNIGKLNGKIFIGAEVLIKKLLQEETERYNRELHGAIYNRCLCLKSNILENIRRKGFQSDYNHFMKRLDSSKQRE